MEPPTVDAEELAGLGSVVAIFYAEWCPYCDVFREALADAELPADADVVEVDVSDPDDPAWDAFGIETIPTAVRLDGGDEVSRVEAAPEEGLSLETFLAFLEGEG